MKRKYVDIGKKGVFFKKKISRSPMSYESAVCYNVDYKPEKKETLDS
jgi:hypothetical protein